jgi:hypothetical protein
MSNWDSARRHGADEKLFHGMVLVEVEVQVRDSDHVVCLNTPTDLKYNAMIQATYVAVNSFVPIQA